VVPLWEVTRRFQKGEGFLKAGYSEQTESPKKELGKLEGGVSSGVSYKGPMGCFVESPACTAFRYLLPREVS